jgi:beta-glucosidase
MVIMSRRKLLPSLMSLFGFARALRPHVAAADELAFPADFVWGTSTSSYQIEGAVNEDGRGKSIWDIYSHTPGRVKNDDTGDVACDHYHRWLEDVEWLTRGGFNAYRFSTAWPRIFPAGAGMIEPRGLDFYDRLVDALLGRGVTPWVCLYHWDLPQALQDEGGWLKRDVAPKFANYARVVARRLGDRVKHWATFNEPNVHALFGHAVGSHAPGLTGLANMLAAIHHQNLAHGQAVQAMRAEHSGLRLGTVVNLQPVRPASERPEDHRAAERFDAFWNGACLDPLLTGAYPRLIADQFAPLIAAGDLEAMHQPVEFLGVNYYAPMYVGHAPESLFGAWWGAVPEGTRFTAMGWPIRRA